MLHFGLELDTPHWPRPNAAPLGDFTLGPRQLLRHLEQELGLSGYPERNDYLRIEMYRQALQQYLTQQKTAFFEASFEADRFATATALLEQRDALVLAGWRSELGGPGRLSVLSAVEAIFQAKSVDPELAILLIGDADRWKMVLAKLPNAQYQPDGVLLYEPLHLLPAHLQRWVGILETKGVLVQYFKDEGHAEQPNGTLEHFQRYLLGETVERNTATVTEQPEIILLHGRSDADLATFLAQTLARNAKWRPSFLIPNLNQGLELAFEHEGLPPFGILSATLGRPALQVLKLAPAFLWQPIDIFKVMEFVTLPLKPIDRGLALEIARVLAEKPGMFSDRWFGAVLGYLDQAGIDESVRESYRFWFDRRRYRIDSTAPKQEAMELYERLQQWALDYHESSSGKDSSLLTLADQARRICDLLRTLPEPRIGFLELERIVRTIVEPAPAFFAETAVGHYPFIHKPGAAIASTDELIWWNCLYEDDAPAPDFWQPAEQQFLTAAGCAPELPQQLSLRKRFLRRRPILQAKRRIWLCMPEQTGGQPALHHLIAADIGALFGQTAAITFHIDQPADRQRLAQLLKIPPQETLAARRTGRPKPWVEINWTDNPEQRHETPTGLESLFYYPHRWFLRQKLGIYPANLLSVTHESRLTGNLAHRFFELLLTHTGFVDMDKKAISTWIDDTAEDLLKKEGATLLLYGREPERKAFLQKVKLAAWNLTSMIRSNGWTVLATEHELHGQFAGVPVHGKADLVLQRGPEKAIIDLKWGGITKRRNMIMNEEDLQLVLYAHLLPPEGEWPHTAYFILEQGKMIARNKAAFTEAQVAAKNTEEHQLVCERIFAKMEKTFHWRIEQLQRGMLEIRTELTAPELDDHYAAVLLELLEMRSNDDRYDDYRTLVGY